MSAYLASPDLGPIAFLFAEETRDAVSERAKRWMREGALVEFITRGEDLRIIVNFALIRSIDVGVERVDTQEYGTNVYFLTNLAHALVAN